MDTKEANTLASSYGELAGFLSPPEPNPMPDKTPDKVSEFMRDSMSENLSGEV